MIVKEIFGPTIQGEGSMSGTPCSFLRLSGCNRWSGLEEHRAQSFCFFCDTDFRGGNNKTAMEIILDLKKLGQKDVVISGGEPALQLNQHDLEQLAEHFDLHLETNGSKDISHISHFFKHVTCSPKQLYKDTNLKFADDLKLLYPYQGGVTIDDFSAFPRSNTFLQPIWFGDNYKTVIKDTIHECYRTGARLSIQTHKILGVK